MEVTREHLGGLELALDSWNDGGPSVQFAAHLHDLIAQAEAAPTGTVKDSLTVEVEIVAYAAFAENGNIQIWNRSCETFKNLCIPIGDPQPLMTVAQHQEIVDRLRGKHAAALALLEEVPDGGPDWPEYSKQGMGCGLEDCEITDPYEAMQHGWEDAVDRCAEAFNNWLHTQHPVPVGSYGPDPLACQGCASGCFRCTPDAAPITPAPKEVK